MTAKRTGGDMQDGTNANEQGIGEFMMTANPWRVVHIALFPVAMLSLAARIAVAIVRGSIIFKMRQRFFNGRWL